MLRVPKGIVIIRRNLSQNVQNLTLISETVESAIEGLISNQTNYNISRDDNEFITLDRRGVTDK
jgi:hypothetical protein